MSTDRCPSELALQRFSLGGEPAAVGGHAAACARCQGRLTELRTEADHFSQVVFPRTVHAVAGARPPRRRTPWGFVVATAGLMTAASLALHVLPGLPAEARLNLKGDPLVLSLFVEANGEPRPLHPGQSIPAGALVHFDVRAASPCWLWVLSVDAQGQLSRYWPDSGSSPRRLTTGGPLPIAAQMDGQRGPERFYALCGESARSLPELEATLRRHFSGDAVSPLRSGARIDGLPGDVLQSSVLVEKLP